VAGLWAFGPYEETKNYFFLAFFFVVFFLVAFFLVAFFLAAIFISFIGEQSNFRINSCNNYIHFMLSRFRTQCDCSSKSISKPIRSANKKKISCKKSVANLYIACSDFDHRGGKSFSFQVDFEKFLA
jgi:hypothetical protein